MTAAAAAAGDGGAAGEPGRAGLTWMPVIRRAGLRRFV